MWYSQNFLGSVLNAGRWLTALYHEFGIIIPFHGSIILIVIIGVHEVFSKKIMATNLMHIADILILYVILWCFFNFNELSKSQIKNKNLWFHT